MPQAATNRSAAKHVTVTDPLITEAIAACIPDFPFTIEWESAADMDSIASRREQCTHRSLVPVAGLRRSRPICNSGGA